MPFDDTISVLIVDDHQMFAQAVANALETIGDIDVRGIAVSVAEARNALGSALSDVVLMDYRLPDGRGTEAARELITSYPGLRVVMLTAANDDTVLTEALRAGCAGYVNKSESLEHLSAAVHAAHAGTTAISPEMLGKLMRRETRAPSGGFTRREYQILQLMVQGLSNAEICDEMGLSSNTIRNHVQGILGKTNAHSRLEAVAHAIKSGLVEPPHREGD